MDLNKSSDVVNIIATLLRDVQTSCSDVFSQRAARLTILKIEKRVEREGISFLTKTLPRLGKAFDKALHSGIPLDSTGFTKIPGSKLPKFMGELFQKVLDTDAMVIQTPCIVSIRVIRQILFVFYKLELPYTDKQEQDVVSQFLQTEIDISHYHETFETIAVELEKAQQQGVLAEETSDNTGALRNLDTNCQTCGTFTKGPNLQDSKVAVNNVYERIKPERIGKVLRKARILLERVFSNFDCEDIVPRHGPGAVSTREKLWGKYEWSSISPRLAAQYPLDAYFFASLGHVCDELDVLSNIKLREVPARVLLVPKDSRGPRLISCEPLAMQWIQQGLGGAIVEYVERHPLTKDHVHFTNQQPNQFGALLGSIRGEYATLDLKEASDRVSVGLVHAMFPKRVYDALVACRSLSTQLPDGRVIPLNKFAPMGSALCFPIMALTIWAILSADTEDADARNSILVYGDDVIVKGEYALHAIQRLESFGLKVNQDKSCVSGFFRESCGVDAYKGVNVTPLRIRSSWPSLRSPDLYTSWIASANQFFDRGYYLTYELIANRLFSIFGCIPHDALCLTAPSLREVPEQWQVKRTRYNTSLQKREYRVWDLQLRPIKHEIRGWLMLLRWFTEGQRARTDQGMWRCSPERTDVRRVPPVDLSTPVGEVQPFSVGSYTKRGSTKLTYRWR